ncbi:SAM-dependent methyltransferase [Undibacterium squillarum]|uniref:tRNA (N6-threonylcarbamoyladenosine(37)-N6)-methyltransferase TrmO n=1 Tax=Undibacterium squillarum TaxID=1131567 RepID=A0ABQ2XSV3_9BURK|nr:SAM-dependent methyltransferase [Undibacterium squillarum]GGX31396.1 tRNA (N6-threonylcarbamoyladenosine(37)-N6)-methyltransferase TrmO [Undibacterium squillarum]
MEITMKPVAYVEAKRLQAQDDFWGNEVSVIRLVDTVQPEALQGLSGFSHVEILFLFHQVDEQHLTYGARHPRNNPAWPKLGIFAQRAKARPNRIGSTICRLLSVDGNALRVAELDAIDGTPVLDIKPVMQEFLPRQAIIQPQWSTELMQDYWSEADAGKP